MQYPGMKERVERELLAMRPFQSHFKVQGPFLKTLWSITHSCLSGFLSFYVTHLLTQLEHLVKSS